MSNQEHLNILRQGMKAWKQWREEHPEIRPDLRDVDLRGAHLSGADLSRADLSRANLSDADLSDADLRGADLSGADLSGADLSSANLSSANLSSANLSDADLSGAYIGWTIFGDVDLSVVKNLETVIHEGPSTIGIDTIYRSGGNIPEAFLRGLAFLIPFSNTCAPLLESQLTTTPALLATPARMMHSPDACMLIYRTTMCAAGLHLKT